ncbi:hypothetical protein HS088_TW13G00027 [Tripterygium wilfordii]|uniref:Uncharacterized protein n=1 Tax=Tripterygium wilfordii TaxID=458696 RepID=A0A7J7CT56_TRIWF|nr:hypothetical protein HS088_TW13G00027 [Tripterygium wilfordii]
MRDKLLPKKLLRKAFKCISSSEKCEKIITISPTKEGSGKLLREEYQFWVDTLPVGACCASVDGDKLVGWHFWDKRSCPRTCGNPRGNNSFWIEPIWSRPSADLKWSTTEF